MQLIDGQLVHTASDLLRFLDCAHLVLLEREVAYRRLSRPQRPDELAKQLQTRGGAVEAAYLTSLEAAGKQVVPIERPEFGRTALEQGAARTASLLAEGVDAVAQAVLFDGTWLGYADVLERVPRDDAASGNEAPRYEVVDTKLAGSVRAAAVVQVAQYSLQLSAVLGAMPRAMHIVLGDGRRETIATAHAVAFVRRLRAQYLATVQVGRVPASDAADPTYPWRVPACRSCAWRDHCDATRQKDDHLTVVPGMRKEVATGLMTTHVATRRALANASPTDLETLSRTIRVPSPTLSRLALGARLSVDADDNGNNRAVVVKRSPVKPLRGVWRIPEASPHDVFIHIEEDPWQAGARLAFAAGVAGRDDVWSTNVQIATERYGEGDLAKALYAAIAEARSKVSSPPSALTSGANATPMHVFLYGTGTDQALRRLSSVHGVMESDLDDWLRAGVIVNLEQACREGIMTGRPYESLADLDAHTGYVAEPAESAGTAGGEPPLVTFERWLARDVDARDVLRTHIRATLARLVKLHAQLLLWQEELVAVVGRPDLEDTDTAEVDPEKAAARAAARAEGRQRGASLEAIAAACSLGDSASPRNESEDSTWPSWSAEYAESNAGGRPGAITLIDDSPNVGGAFLEPDATSLADDQAPVAPPDMAREASAVGLLRHLLDWHRREARTQWWEYFGHRQMDESDHLEDTRALGGLMRVGSSSLSRNRERREYTFPIGQEHAFAVGDSAEVTNWENGTVHVASLDNEAGTITLEATSATWASNPEPQALAPFGPVRDEPLRTAVARVADHVIASWEAATAHGQRASLLADHSANDRPSEVGLRPPMSGPGRYRAARRLLLGEVPRVPEQGVGAPLSRPGETATDAAVRIARQMAPGVLAIQGPPGTGKTYTAARMILALLRDGLRVGVTANSHKAIGNVLLAVVKAADEAGVPDLVRGIQKATREQASGAPGVEWSNDNATVERALDVSSGVNLFAGTAWLFARPQFDEALDVLFVDEAGQVALANAVAVATCARRVILLGDPQQLSQPTNGEHPPGAGASALEHLLGDAETMPPDRGIFLDRSYRMHPSICAFVSAQFYDGRLVSADGCDLQRLDGPRLAVHAQPGSSESQLWGAGLRFVPVAHQGNRTQSREEADKVVQICQEALGRIWTTERGSRAITVDDILVVAPYNRQVDLLTSMVPPGVRVGTVDRFQGQEAPVVVYSLAASEATEASRGVAFLLDLHRMNVAISRARGVAAVVCSPRLLATQCHSLEEIRQVNALCAFVEASEEEWVGAT
jgi:predicted RecB family nuclease